MNEWRKRISRNEAGSALLVSLMVIVGLSLLGLGFVTLSETETAIARNQQADLQTQAVAEAGAKLVVEWFQDPAWAVATAGCPANGNNSIKIVRTADTYSGYYKPDSGTLLFDKPYRPNGGDRLYGAEVNPDIKISYKTDLADLNKLNDFLLGSNAYDKTFGEITEVDIYAPPMVGATLTPDTSNPPKYFYVGCCRFGLATIKVTAQQFKDPTLSATGANPPKYQPSNVISTHAVRLVVGELPLPIPAGPIQGNANVSFGGNFRVHWGMETSEGTLTPSLNYSSLPWANAYERPHFEHGYEPGGSIGAIIVTNGGSGYTAAPSVTIASPGGGGTTATATATIDPPTGRVIAITVGDPGSRYTYNPPPPVGTGTPGWGPVVTISGGGGTGATAVASIGTQHWPITGANYDDANYFNEVLNKDYQDPWYGARAKGDNNADGTTPVDTNFQCFGYAYTSQENTSSNPSYDFQWQDTNSYPQQKLVSFPVIKYAFWKKVAQQGRGYKGLYYFTYDQQSGNFKKFNQGNPDTVANWVNTKGGGHLLGPGVYFFDTTTGADPQIFTNNTQTNTNTSILTPALNWGANDFGQNFLMVGFIYLNAANFGTQGQGTAATRIQANFPGEPFRDVGFPVWCTGAGVAQGVTLKDPTVNCPAANQWANCGGAICYQGAGDAVFSYQDMNNNGKFDVVVTQAPAWTSYDPGATGHAANSTWRVKTWKPDAQAMADYSANCTMVPATGPGLNSDCSEPHEPYLNFIYPDVAQQSNGQPSTVTVGWEDPTNQTRRAKVLGGSGAPITCAQSSAQSDCTSNAYDVDGGIVPLDVILDGILYNEGDYAATGNSWYFGSLLIRGTIGGTSGPNAGTADVWFDEKLLKGNWAPPGMPRVIVFNEKTDETSQ